MKKHFDNFDSDFDQHERRVGRMFKLGATLWVLWVLFIMSLIGAGAYVAYHFISKYW